MKNIFITILLISSVSLYCCKSYSKNKGKSYPKDGTVILTYNITPSPMLPLKQSGPRLTIFKDGRVVAGDPDGFMKSGKVLTDHITYSEGRISKERLSTLMRFVVEEKEFYKISQSEIKEREKKNPQKADCSTTTFEVRTDKGNHRIRVYDFQRKAKLNFISYQKLHVIAIRLEKLRKEILN